MSYNFSHNLNWFSRYIRKNKLNSAKKTHPLGEDWASALHLRNSDFFFFGAEFFNPILKIKIAELVANSGLNFAHHAFSMTAKVRKDTTDDLAALEAKMINNPNMYDPDFYQTLTSEVNAGGTAESVHEYISLFANQWSAATTKGVGAEQFSDEVFANQTVAGPCPTVIKRFKTSDFYKYSTRGFEVGNEIFLKDSPFTKAGDNDLHTIAQEGRLYIQDFSRLDNIKGSDIGAGSTEKRYIFAPYALYAVTKGSTPKLLPIAIQMRQTDREANSWDPIFVPHMHNAVTSWTDSIPSLDNDPNSMPEYSWEVAKIAVSSATHVYHQFSEHLGLTHLMLENVALSMIRTLPQNHPVYGILQAHFEGTRAINRFARETLVNKGGFIVVHLGFDGGVQRVG